MKLKVVKKTGLVPVKLLVSSLPYAAGEIIGLTAVKAVAAIKEKHATQDGIDFSGVDIEERSVGETSPRSAVKPDPNPGETQPAPDRDPAKAAAEDMTDEEAARRSSVDIPDDWEGEHHMTRIGIATDLVGEFNKTDEKSKTEVANDVIRAELERRAAAAGE